MIRCLCLIALLLSATLPSSLSAGPQKARESAGLRLTRPGDSGLTRRFQLYEHKSAIVDLPVDVADILVSEPEIVDAIARTTKRIYLYGKKIGQANVFLFDDRGRELGQLEIRVEPDLTDLQNNLSRLLPSARITVQAMNDTIILSGTVENAPDATFAQNLAARFAGNPDQVLNNLTISGQEQVLLRVRVLEMQRSAIKQLGVDLGAAFSAGDVLFDVATSNPFSLIGRSLGGLGAGTAAAGSSVFWQSGSDILSSNLQAFERNGLVRTLAEPNLTAISGEAASFLAGGEFPVPTSRDRDGNVTVSFKPFGVGLGFTPVVLGGERISLRISTEVSELSSDGAFLIGGTGGAAGLTIPALSVRRAETTVELPSGGSLIIAGLIQESTKQNIDGVPGLKGIPVLGALFRSRGFRNSETELIVIVTPFLVDAMPAAAIDTPGDGYRTAHDLETFFLGRLTDRYGSKVEKAIADLESGGFGYILE